jgi:hypothetical protein
MQSTSGNYLLSYWPSPLFLIALRRYEPGRVRRIAAPEGYVSKENG